MANQLLHEDQVILTLLAELKRLIGPDLKELWLFGSRARGDAQDGSDYDILVIASGELPVLKKKVRDAEWTCMERHNALVAGIVYTPGQWVQRKNSPLGRNILREGLLVA